MLVAGGLGERLGYSGIKLALPVDSARGTCFLQVWPLSHQCKFHLTCPMGECYYKSFCKAWVVLVDWLPTAEDLPPRLPLRASILSKVAWSLKLNGACSAFCCNLAISTSCPDMLLSSLVSAAVVEAQRRQEGYCS